MTLIQELEKVQADNGLNSAEFARTLGITRVAWFNIRKASRGVGGRSIGPGILSKIVRTYPHLKPKVIEYLETFPIKHERIAA